MKKNNTYGIQDAGLIEEIRNYWNQHIHDLEIARHPVGSQGFFKDLEAYRFEKLHYLPRKVDFAGFKDKSVLEIGCGVGIDLARFASGGARVTGIDLAEKSIELARKNFDFQSLKGDLKTGNGEELECKDNSFDCVYAHGVIQYTANAQAMIDEIHRVLKPGGTAILMVYNRHSWMNFLSRTLKVKMEHTDAPVLRKYTRKEFSRMLKKFSRVDMFTERFPVKSRLQKGLKAVFFNILFVPVFNLIPRIITRKTGWHIMALTEK
jgi:2-polyprenyl-3-methyl-5-hydroxy-6-metoxy-1,4-benzoquinol methylase